MAGVIRTVKVGEKDITFTANGATFVLYQQAFNKDGLTAFTSLADNGEDLGVVSLMQEFAYVMSGAYTKGISYIDWLSQFGFMDLPNAIPEIMEVLNDNVTGNVKDEESGKNPQAVEN